ncbi:flagellar filament capping protein FliD [Roseateles sp.]|uniref:flagellar filament capping protein FliD n=1 Tax=Roseateles sp. TaxID=1971397 RepID=UPI0025E7F0BE|nr:flagellar filament capping protein FliD [Roseateles sp.]MBV8036780.1 flagellar filament capping protein FliD [Roseateles sp.]
MTTTYDPTSTATSLAKAYTAAAQSLIDTQKTAATSTSSALTKLQSALSSFQTALGSLSSVSSTSSLLKMGATPSDTAVASATANAKAAPGSYSLFVEQLASNQQIAFKDLPATAANAAGKITLSLGSGESFEVDLAVADVDGNGTLSYAEIARAVNAAQGNQGKVTAMVSTVNGKSSLIFSSGVGGASGEISVSADGNVDAALAAVLNGPPQELVAARDAIVWLGAKGSGLEIRQNSNTITAIEGVTLTLKAAQAVGSAPMTLAVAQDTSATKDNIAGFVNAYNTLRGTLDSLLKSGGEGSTAGPLANDSGLKSLRDRLASLLRQDVGGLNLRGLGFSLDRAGKLSLDGDKLAKALTTTPDALDGFLGKATLTSRSGLLGSLANATEPWTNSTGGLLKKRQDGIGAQQRALSERQTRLDARYDQMYGRYLKQFSALQAMQEQMSKTSGLLDSLFSSK